MPRDMNTAHYEVSLTFNIVERNQYGDALNDNVITFTRHLKAKGLRELANAIANVDDALSIPLAQ